MTITILITTCASAQTTLDWNTIDGGGTSLIGGGIFTVAGTIGQPDAAPLMAGGIFSVTGGFWPGVAPPPDVPGDTDGDGDVDLSDLSTLLSHFGATSGATRADGDFDADGDVDISDLSRLLSHYGTTP